MRLCSSDPDTERPSFALFVDRKLTDWIELRGKNGSWIHQIPPLIEKWQPQLLAIENQYLPLQFRNRARSIFSLVAARGAISACFMLANIPVELVEPFSWSQILGGSRLGREQLKIRSFIVASEIAGVKIESEHIADSICLGQWWISTHHRRKPA